MQHYADFGDAWLIELMTGLKDALIYNNADLCQKLREQKIRTKKYEKEQEKEKVTLESIKKKIVEVSKENRDIKKQEKRLKTLKAQEERTTRLRTNRDF